VTVYQFGADAVCVDFVAVASNDSSIMSSTAVTMAATSSSTVSAAAASSVVSRVLSSEIYTSPQSAALRYLVSL